LGLEWEKEGSEKKRHAWQEGRDGTRVRGKANVRDLQGGRAGKHENGRVLGEEIGKETAQRSYQTKRKPGSVEKRKEQGGGTKPEGRSKSLGGEKDGGRGGRG